MKKMSRKRKKLLIDQKTEVNFEVVGNILSLKGERE